jgi:OOP family OmpA-OmpF porin
MRSTTQKLLGLAFVVLVALTVAGDARAQGVYLGGAYSWATLDIEDVDSDTFDDNANAYKLFLGYEFPKFIGLEAGYVDFGDYEVGDFDGEGGTGEINSSGWTAALTGRIPLGKLFTVYGKVGYFFWDAELKTASEFGDLTDDGDDPFYGAGLRVNFGKFSVFGEYEMFDSSDYSNDLVSLGVRFTF